MALRDQEPFATFQSDPMRFALGLPLVFIGGAVVGAMLLPTSIRLALAVQLALQTGGFILLYVPALRRRLRDGDDR
jgi:hypothetical protein